MLYTLLSLLLKLSALVAAGFVLTRRGHFGENEKKCVTALLMHLVLYFTILVSSQQAFTPELGRSLLIAAVFGVVFYAVSIPLTVLLSRRLKLEEKKRRVFVTSSCFCNIAFVGYPILLELCGQAGLLCGVVFTMVFNLFFYSWGMAYLGGRTDWRSLLKNKMMLASLAAMLLYFLRLRVPEPVLSAMTALSGMATPLSMLLVGYSLASSGFLNILLDKTLYPISLLRMLVMPAAVFAVMRLLGIDSELMRICTLITALPCGAMTTIVAAQQDCAPDYAASAMVQTTMLMVLTLPAWVAATGI